MVVQFGDNIGTYPWIYIVISEDGVFTGGDATTRPTAVLEYTVINNTYLLSNNSDPYNEILNVQMSTDGLNFRAWVYRNGSATGLIALDTPVDNTGGAWLDNPRWVFYGYGETALTERVTYGYYYSINTNCRTRINGSACQPYFTSEVFDDGKLVADYYTKNELTDEWVMAPIGLYCTNTNRKGRHGRMRDIWWVNADLVNEDTFPVGPRSHIIVGDFALPWDGSNPIISA